MHVGPVASPVPTFCFAIGTGQLVKLPPPHTYHRMQTPYAMVLDPQRHGDVLLKLSCKHGTTWGCVVTAGMRISTGSEAEHPVMLPLRNMAAGHEQSWNYAGDVAEPGECNLECCCGGKVQQQVPLLGRKSFVELDACPRTLFRAEG